MKRIIPVALVAIMAGMTLHAQNPSTALGAGNVTHVGQDPGHSKYSMRCPSSPR